MRITFDKYDKLMPINELKVSKHQRNKHPKEQIERLAKLMREQGVRHPIHISKLSGEVCFGHGRWEAAKLNKFTKYPIVYQDFKDDKEEYACVQSDNAIAGWAELDLANIISDLGKLGKEFDIELLGIKDFKIPADPVIPGCDEDEVPEKVEAKSKLGDIYELGSHRLMCGDSTSIDAVDLLMMGNKADMVFTDPPYGVNFEQGKFIGREKRGKNKGFAPIANDEKKGEDLKEFVQLALSNAALASDVASIYVWSPPLLEGFSILRAIIDSGWHVQSQLIWNKTPFVIGRADYHWKHEVCWYGYKGKNHTWNGGRNKATVWDIPKTRISDSHPTMKPVELAEVACNNNTDHGHKVLDLFGGSGSTLIACEKTNRKCFMMEIDPHYCDVIIARWEKYTNKKAELMNGKAKEEHKRRPSKTTGSNKLLLRRNGSSPRV